MNREKLSHNGLILAAFGSRGRIACATLRRYFKGDAPMQLLIDFFPIIVFFAAYKYAGMYAATGAIIVAMGVQIAIQWFRQGTVNKMLLTSGALVAVFGGITLAVRDPIFIQWKPTIVNALFAGAFLASRFFGDQTLTERMMGHAIELSQEMWRQLNLMWIGNFAFLRLVRALRLIRSYSVARQLREHSRFFKRNGEERLRSGSG